MRQEKTLADLLVGEKAYVTALSGGGPMRRRLLDIGLVPNARVVCVGQSPGGDPRAYLVCGAVIAIRRKDARGVLVSG